MSLLPRQVLVLLTGIVTAGALAIYGTTKGCDLTRDGACFVRNPGAGGFHLAADTSSRFYVAAVVVALFALVVAASPWARRPSGSVRWAIYFVAPGAVLLWSAIVGPPGMTEGALFWSWEAGVWVLFWMAVALGCSDAMVDFGTWVRRKPWRRHG